MIASSRQIFDKITKNKDFVNFCYCFMMRFVLTCSEHLLKHLLYSCKIPSYEYRRMNDGYFGRIFRCCATYNFIIIGVVYVQLQTPSSGDCIHQCS